MYDLSHFMRSLKQRFSSWYNSSQAGIRKADHEQHFPLVDVRRKTSQRRIDGAERFLKIAGNLTEGRHLAQYDPRGSIHVTRPKLIVLNPDAQIL